MMQGAVLALRDIWGIEFESKHCRYNILKNGLIELIIISGPFSDR